MKMYYQRRKVRTTHVGKCQRPLFKRNGKRSKSHFLPLVRYYGVLEDRSPSLFYYATLYYARRCDERRPLRARPDLPQGMPAALPFHPPTFPGSVYSYSMVTFSFTHSPGKCNRIIGKERYRGGSVTE